MTQPPEKSIAFTIRPEEHADSGRIAVIGLGNILLSDEGVGVHAINSLRSSFTFQPDIDLIDGGTMGLDLLPLFQSRERILIIDAVDFGRSPGHVDILPGSRISTVLNAKLSVHHIGLSDLLFASKLTRSTEPDVWLIGIQPLSLDVGLDMTAIVRVQLPQIVERAIGKLQEWNVQCVSRSPQKSSP